MRERWEPEEREGSGGRIGAGFGAKERGGERGGGGGGGRHGRGGERARGGGFGRRGALAARLIREEECLEEGSETVGEEKRKSVGLFSMGPGLTWCGRLIVHFVCRIKKKASHPSLKKKKRKC